MAVSQHTASEISADAAVAEAFVSIKRTAVPRLTKTERKLRAFGGWTACFHFTPNSL